MAQICGISGDSDESTRARAFVESIAAMNQTGGVPERLAEFPRAEIDAVIKEAFQECHGTYPVPRYYTRPGSPCAAGAGLRGIKNLEKKRRSR